MEAAVETRATGVTHAPYAGAMPTVRRDFAGPGDLRAMQDMASRLWSPTSRFHPGQLAWSRYYRPVDPMALDDGESIAAWSDGDETVGLRLGRVP